MKNSSVTIKLAGQITALKERFGIASAQAESWKGNCNKLRKIYLEKNKEQQKNAGKIDRTFLI